MASWVEKGSNHFVKPAIREFSVNAITAFAGGGQQTSGASILTGGVNRITTVASRLDSVTLPATVPVAGGAATWLGAELVVINSGVNVLAVFPAPGDQINALAANTSVLVMPGEVVVFVCPVSQQWFAEVGIGVSGSLPTDLTQDGIAATGAQGTTVLTAELNRVTSGVGGVTLPASAPGLGIIVINAQTTQGITVYGAGTDTVDTIAGATGVAMMPASVAFFFCTATGAWFTEGLATGFATSLGLPTVSFVNALSAAGATQGTATPVTSVLNRVTTVALSTGVILPVSVAGLQMVIMNAGANPLTVYPAVGDKFQTLAINAGFSLAVNTTLTLYCSIAGVWHGVLSAAAV